MNWIKNNLDKLLHLLMEFFIMVILGRFIGIFWALLIGMGLGFGKEACDQLKYQGWDWNDLIADGIGIALAILFLCFV
jgi:hypothetical protein